MKYSILAILALVAIAFFSSMSFLGPQTISEKADKQLKKDALILCKKYKLDFLSISDSRILESKDEHADFTINMMSYREMTKEEVRELCKSFTQDFWKALKSNPIYLDYAIESWGFKKIKEKPLHPFIMGIKLSFWDKQMDRRGAPYVSLIKVMEGKFLYYYADSATQKLQEPVVETFEEMGLKFE